jgi:hypothetical protein
MKRKLIIIAMENGKGIIIQARKREKSYTLHRNCNCTNMVIDFMF